MTPEDVIQQQCVMWFRNTYCLKTKIPRLAIFTVPNSGKDMKEQLHKKATGMMAGVADLCVLLPRGKTVFIEVKTNVGRQSESQIEFEKIVTDLGFDYFIIRSLEEFKNVILPFII